VNDEDLVTIGGIAAATGLSVPALRHYDEIGLLKPAHVDAETGYRRYRHEQIDQARLICGLRGLGLPIDAIRGLKGTGPGGVRVALSAHRERLLAQVRDLTQRIAAVDEFLDKGTTMPEPQQVRPVQLRLPVRDVDEATDFYITAFDPVFLADISSLQFGTYRSDRFFLVTLEHCEAAEAGPVHFGLLVADLALAHRRALDAGGAEVYPPTDFAWKPRTSCVKDPSRNLVDLSQG
jgi:DNA-binding transcriptional MerR regulator